MFYSIREFFVSQKKFSWLSIFGLAYAVSFFCHYLVGIQFLKPLQIVGGVFFMFFGAGLAAALIIQSAFKRNFDTWEFLSLLLLSGMLTQPFLLMIEFMFFGSTRDWLPIFNLATLWIGAGILLKLKKAALPDFSISKTSLFHPLSIVTTLGFIFTLTQTLIYPALPDLDPYKWLVKYAYQFPSHMLDYTERPLFGSLVFIGTRLTGMELFPFFKYILPFLYLSALAPAWMIARNFVEAKKQWFFLFFIFVSPVVMSYAQASIPQSVLIVLTYYFVFLLLHSFQKNDNFFFYVAGVSILLSFFYHQAAVVMLLAWILVTALSQYKIFFSDKKTFILVALIMISNAPRLSSIYKFALSWIQIIFLAIIKTGGLNLLYPARYTNVDLSPMGWGSLSGVMKFYAFYTGPLLGGLLLSFLYLVVFKHSFRLFFWRKVWRSAPILIIFLSLLSFFAIAEIFPRFLNLALLPDRAWIFCGILSFLLLFFALQFFKNIPNWIIAAYAIILIGSLSGATYVNLLKRYLITPGQWESAGWIEKNLPKNRIFLSYGHKNLLPVHANTPLIRIPSEAYCGNDPDSFQKLVDRPNLSKSFLAEYSNFLKNTQTEIRDNILPAYLKDASVIEANSDVIIKTKEILSAMDYLKKNLNKKSQTSIIYPVSKNLELSAPVSIESVYRFNTVSSLEENQLYVYYARQDKRNPYRGRPYKMTTWGIDPCPDGKFLFDTYPDKFRRVYSASDDEVIIWKVL